MTMAPRCLFEFESGIAVEQARAAALYLASGLSAPFAGNPCSQKRAVPGLAVR